MKSVLANSGIKVFENCDITDWKINDTGFVSMLTVESDLGVIEMPCTLLVCFERPIVPRRTITGKIDPNLNMHSMHTSMSYLQFSTMPVWCSTPDW